MARARNAKGYNIAEMPAGMWLLFVGFGLPVIIISSLAYRALLAQYATRDSCNRACKAQTYTIASNLATNNFNKDIASFTGISGTEQLSIVVKPLAGGAVTVSTTKLAPNSVDTGTYLYFFRSTSTCQIDPLTWCQNGWMGMNIPGLTAPYPLTIMSESYVENPNGLTQ